MSQNDLFLSHSAKVAVYTALFLIAGKSSKTKSRIFDPNEDSKLKEKLEKVAFTAFRLLGKYTKALKKKDALVFFFKYHT